MLIQLRETDGTWQEFCDTWSRQCVSFGENFEAFDPASLEALGKAASEPIQPVRSKAFSLKEGDRFKAAFWACCTTQPGFDGTVLRVRHIVPEPAFELSDEYTVTDYVDVLVEVFSAAIRLSASQMKANHLKFHFRSPTERQFGEEFVKIVRQSDHFSASDIRGGWITLSKNTI